jgi:DNA repair protein RadD
MRFEDILNRFDFENWQMFLGEDVVRLLSILGPFEYSHNFVQLALTEFDIEECLTNERRRGLIVDRLSREELGSVFGVKEADNPWGVAKLSLKKPSERHKWLRVLGATPRIKNRPNDIPQQIVNPDFGLRDYQSQLVRDLHELMFEEGESRVLLHLPTGAGKTRVAMNFVVNGLRINKYKKILWVASMNELVDQAYEAAVGSWKALGNEKLFITTDVQRLAQWDAGIAVSTLQMLRSMNMRNFENFKNIICKYDLLIFDEAHQITAPTYDQLVRIIEQLSSCQIIGLSATPGLTYNNPQTDQRLSEFFRRKKVTISREFTTHPINYLVENEYLAKAEFEQVDYEGELNLECLKSSANEPALLSNKDLEGLSRDEKRNAIIVQKIRQLTSVHLRIIVFALTVEHAEAIALSCRAFGVEAWSISYNTPDAKRDDLIAKFKNSEGGHMVLVNVGLLTTGFDAPIVNCVFITRPTDSLVLFSQMVGRALRGPKSGGSKFAKIVTVNDIRLPGFGSVQDAFFNWEDIWN